MPPPNILLITTDQQRFDATGGSGPDFLRTPHYDHLCRDGITFTSAYSDCPLCVPARVSIMTGKLAQDHGMLGNGPTDRVMGRMETLPAVLRTLGYQTAAIGKMHFTPERARHGFDEMVLPADYYRRMALSGSPLQPMRHGLGQNELYPGMATVPESQTLTSWIAEQCVEYVLDRRDPTVPFFLWCSFSKPHPPLDPPEPYYSMYRNCSIPDPVAGDWAAPGRAPAAFERMRQRQSYDRIPLAVLREARAAYYGLITQIDYNMGRIFSALQDIGMFNDTLILYTSDHGEYLGDHHSGSKCFFHECSAHVPFALKPPTSWDRRCAGARLSHLVTHADILPTLVAAAGGAPPAGCTGMDLMSLARGERAPRPYLECIAPPDGERGHLSITDGRWKYSWFPEGPAEQLFDLAADPRELRDLAGAPEHQEKRRELQREIIRRQQARNSSFVADGRLLGRPVMGDTEAERRAKPWPGYHTERYGVDVRH